jgi:hypothetical protein
MKSWPGGRRRVVAVVPNAVEGSSIYWEVGIGGHREASPESSSTRVVSIYEIESRAYQKWDLSCATVRTCQPVSIMYRGTLSDDIVGDGEGPLVRQARH